MQHRLCQYNTLRSCSNFLSTEGNKSSYFSQAIMKCSGNYLVYKVLQVCNMYHYTLQTCRFYSSDHNWQWHWYIPRLQLLFFRIYHCWLFYFAIKKFIMYFKLAIFTAMYPCYQCQEQKDKLHNKEGAPRRTLDNIRADYHNVEKDGFTAKTKQINHSVSHKPFFDIPIDQVITIYSD